MCIWASISDSQSATYTIPEKTSKKICKMPKTQKGNQIGFPFLFYFPMELEAPQVVFVLDHLLSSSLSSQDTLLRATVNIF
jgi:hypothetical protein